MGLYQDKNKAMTKILIVEDDPANILVFTKIIVKRGKWDVVHTEDAEEVVKLAESKTIDLILMDVSLTHSTYQGKPVDGIEITRLLKSNPTTAQVPIILVTAHAMQGDRENFLNQSGADDYISKPVVDQDAFVGQIRTLITAGH
jgi:CheY-like chemotaxis protein